MADGELNIETAMLLDLGLQEPEAVLWQKMLMHPGAGIEELAGMLGVAAEEIRADLDRLADLALIRASRKVPGLMVPVAAEAGLSILLSKQEEKVAERHQKLEVHRGQITSVIAASTASTASDPSEIEFLHDPDTIQARFEQFAYSATQSVHSLLPGGTVPANVLEEAWPLDRTLLDRGIRLRLVYQDAIRNHPATLAYVRNLVCFGAAVRVSPVLGQRLFICDDKLALLPLDPRDPKQGAACVSAPGVVASLVELFELAWEAATPFDDDRPVDDETMLTDSEHELLAMLATGMTDGAAAKRLGISLRTTRRMMADLMSRLGAGSRFEAGLKAAKRGWL